MNDDRASWADCLPPLVLFLISLGFVLIGLTYNPATRSVPELIGGTMVVLTALDVASRMPIRLGRQLVRWLNPSALTEAHEKVPRRMRIRQWIAMAGAVAVGAMLTWFGVLYSVPVFVFVAIRFGAGRGWLFSLVLAAVTTLAIWGLFTPLLGLDLWPGLVFGGEW